MKSTQKISETDGGFTGDLDGKDQFGTAVGNAGDINADGIDDLIVGAINDDEGGSNRGAAYLLFLNPNGTVLSQQKIASGLAGFTGTIDNADFFGCAVAGMGDVDSDDIPDLLIGAYKDLSLIHI